TVGARFDNAGQDGGAFDKLLNFIFGADSLYTFKNVTSMNLDPMVGLMGIGDKMVTRSITAVGVVVVASGISAIAGAIPNPVSEFVATLFDKLAGLAYLVVLIGLGAGLMLFYLLPLMPFIYFFFAIASWVMEIFEAIVA
ncbi:MAG: hypothetical protein CUN55_19365, partial [Phototrophicales bacterium]